MYCTTKFLKSMWALPKGRALHYIFLFRKEIKKDAISIPNAKQ